MEEDEEPPEDILDIVSFDEIIYPDDWFTDWARNQKAENEEVAEWIYEHDGLDLEADRWREFADDFPEAKKEFFRMLEDL